MKLGGIVLPPEGYGVAAHPPSPEGLWEKYHGRCVPLCPGAKGKNRALAKKNNLEAQGKAVPTSPVTYGVCQSVLG